LLSLADIGTADFLLTGDKKAGLLSCGRVASAQIVTATVFSNVSISRPRRGMTRSQVPARRPTARAGAA
jgi:hypothetical protein